MPDSLQPHGLQSAKLLRPCNFPGKYTGVGCTSPAIKFFTIRILYPLSHQGSPKSIPKYWCHLPIFRTSALFSKYHNSALFRKNRICIFIIFKHNLVKKFFLILLLFILFYFIFKLYNIVLVLPNIKMNLPQVYLCSPFWTLLPPPSPYPLSGSSQCTSPKHPVSCIEPGLATRFIHDIIHVSMLFSQISPPSPSPSPTESIRLIYTSVSLLLSRTQGYCYHLSKFHIYALVYCTGVFLSGLLHKNMEHFTNLCVILAQGPC